MDIYICPASFATRGFLSTGVARGGGERGSCPGQHFWSFVGNVLSQIRFKCLYFAQKCCQKARNAISETQISKIFQGVWPRTPLVGCALRRVHVSHLGAAYLSFAPGGKSACYVSVSFRLNFPCPCPSQSCNVLWTHGAHNFSNEKHGTDMKT